MNPSSYPVRCALVALLALLYGTVCYHNITGSTIRDNESVSRSAGGIFGGTVMIVDSTISGNKPLAIEDQGGA